MKEVRPAADRGGDSSRALAMGAARSGCREAHAHVYGDRHAAYGHPAVDHGRVGRIWGALLGLPDLPAWMVDLMLVGVKMSRECNGHQRDNCVDMAGYAECCRICREEPPPPGADGVLW